MKLFTDGGSRGNPGESAVAYFIFNDDSSLKAFGSDYLGIQTNNFAEYTALINGLKTAILNDIKKLDCYLDSELVVKQLNGQYKVRNEEIKKLYLTILNLKREFGVLTFNNIPRKENAFADQLVNIVLDAKDTKKY